MPTGGQALQGKNVLITGAGRGIGKRLAIGFAAAGARIGLIARSKAEVDLVALEIEHNGGNVVRLRGDVRDYEKLAASIDRFRTALGNVDVLICAAAVQGQIIPLYQATPRHWAETIETNLIGVMYSCRAVLPQMVVNRSGKVIVLSGGGATSSRPNFSAYAASKAAIVRLVETAADEVRDHNVQINCMSPGGTYTNMTDEILKAGDLAGWKEREDAMQVRITGGIAPERQLELAKFLASEESNHITGKVIHVKDDWKKLAHAALPPDAYTLRRVERIK